jgi:hypothetical protein
MKFRTTVLRGGKNATGIRVPAEVVEQLGSGKRPAVTVTINGYSYRSTVAVMGGEFLLPVSAEVRAGAGIAADDEIEVELELDTQPREIVVPDDLASALSGASEAKVFFNGLSYSNRRRIVLHIEGAKTAETRQRRVEKAIEGRREGRVI